MSKKNVKFDVFLKNFISFWFLKIKNQNFFYHSGS